MVQIWQVLLSTCVRDWPIHCVPLPVCVIVCLFVWSLLSALPSLVRSTNLNFLNMQQILTGILHTVLIFTVACACALRRLRLWCEPGVNRRFKKIGAVKRSFVLQKAKCVWAHQNLESKVLFYQRWGNGGWFWEPLEKTSFSAHFAIT